MNTDPHAYPAIPVPRGCGTRVRGGIYFECGFAPPGAGRPLEDFIFCPPVDLPPGLSVPARGVALMTDGDGVTHIIDRIGLSHYPNVLDFLEEVRRFGVSRRLPANLDFSRLTPESRLIIVHDRGRILNYSDYGPAPSCPRAPRAEPRDEARRPHSGFCAGYWRHDIEDGKPLTDDPTTVRRQMPSFAYAGHPRPAGVVPQYQPAAIASFPCSRLVTVAGDKAASNHAAAARSSLPTTIVDQ